MSGEGLPGGKTVEFDDRRERRHSVWQERNFADVISQGKAMKVRIFMGDCIIRKVDKIVNRKILHHGMPTRGKNRGCSREGRTCHGWWHGKCSYRACGNEQCREGGNAGHRW